ncbi:MAG TPA: cupin domain-containing protein [Gaiellaceae bacterium]|nr:cupin domain-containing protein [Gaiellaceae bacterium]
MTAAGLMNVSTPAGGARRGSGPGRVVLERASSTRGAMAPLHSRDEDETFTMVEGELTFFVGAHVVPAKAGDVVVVPRHVPRTIRVESDRARWLVATRARSPARFDDFGRALARPLERGAAVWTSAEDEATLRALGAANGTAVLGPPGRLPSEL